MTLLQDYPISVGHQTVIRKTLRLPVQAALGASIHKGVIDLGMELTHRHVGMPYEHPIALRHTKSQMDAYHKEEDGLVDEWRDLFAKAQEGHLTANDIKRLREIKTRISEINKLRIAEAQGVLGSQIHNATARKDVKDPAEFQNRPVTADALHERGDYEASDPAREQDIGYGDASVGVAKGARHQYGASKRAALQKHSSNVIPRNDGPADAKERSESIYGEIPEDERVYVAMPSEVSPAPTYKHVALTGIRPIPMNQKPLTKALGLPQKPRAQIGLGQQRIVDEV